MSVKAVNEYTAKCIINHVLKDETFVSHKLCLITSIDDIKSAPDSHPWLLKQKLVCKPDELIKRRGKLGLIGVNIDFNSVCRWISERMLKPITIGSKTGVLRKFLIEPFIPHQITDEHYICMFTQPAGDVILFCSEGGVDVGDVDSKAKRFVVTTELLSRDSVSSAFQLIPAKVVESGLLNDVQDSIRKELLADFIARLHAAFARLHFNYLEINPLVVCPVQAEEEGAGGGETNNNLGVHILDVAAKVDQCAEYLFLNTDDWSYPGFQITFPPQFGRTQTAEERFVSEIDGRTGASMKLTLLNPDARIWTISAGGGASVIFADTICQLAPNGAADLANYGEYSGAPTEEQTFDYARTIIGLITRGSINPQGKVLLIGGGVANFTNVAATFKGIITAIKNYQVALREHMVTIWVRRGGPNYQEGLQAIRRLGETLNLPIHVFGPETHMTAIVSMALGLQPVPDQTVISKPSLYQQCFSSNCNTLPSSNSVNGAPVTSDLSRRRMFTAETRCIIWGLQMKAVQSMLDFDFACSRTTPSVAALVYPFTSDRMEKFYWGADECFLPIFKSMHRAFDQHPDVRVLVNFASYRAAYQVSLDAMAIHLPGVPDKPQLDCMVIIAEGIPERFSRHLAFEAKRNGILLIGPATVGGIKPGCFKVGNTAGMMDNIIASRLHRTGSVAYVSRSGGMSNELNNIISLNSDGVAEGIAIGGDRFSGSSFLDHVLRYEADPDVAMIVLLGEVGGCDEYAVAEAMEKGLVKKPLVAWCIGTCAEQLARRHLQSRDGDCLDEVQFGHAGACARSARETAVAKNERLAAAGAYVPVSFNELDSTIRKVFNDLLNQGLIPKPDRPVRPVPMDYSWARELGLIRRPAAFTSTISDDRGQELLYAGLSVSQVLESNMGIGGVLGLLWFKRRLPSYACEFLERCIILAADHGPAVSGAHNTIVAARADKDLVSSLASGLLTIGNRFGGALDAAARQFSGAFDSGLSPTEFVASEREAGRLLMGIGHRIKSVTNPDTRVHLLAEFARRSFPATPLIDYAFEVEKITTAKRPTLILNVDGLMGVAMVDLLRQCGLFSELEAKEFVQIGTLNGLFVLARSIGFIGHFLDQKRLRQNLYRHPWEDISYKLPKFDHDGDC